MEELLKSSVIKALVFSAHAKFGSQPIYMFPKEVSEEELKEFKSQNAFKLTLRDYTQISIKNLSLFISDREVSLNDDLQEFQYFGILPYPDFQLTSLTFFHFIKTDFIDKPVPCAFSILVDEIDRSFLYNNINQIKPIIIEFSKRFDKEILGINDFKSWQEIEPFIMDFIINLRKIEKEPYTLVATQRKIKVLFVGLDDSGKSSFLLSVDRKYSKLMRLKPTHGVDIKSINILGLNIFIWDLGGQSGFRERYINKAQIYLYEADLLFYFIDVKNKDRFEESFDYLQNVNKKLKDFRQKTPIVFVLSKADPDILDSKEIKENIKLIKSRIIEITSEVEPETFTTSIFDNFNFSILRTFSLGLSKLSPNRELINLNLRYLSIQSGVYFALLLNNDGLDLADFYSNEMFSLPEFKPSQIEGIDVKNVYNIFETSAPQFAILYKIFAKFKTLKQEEAIFKMARLVFLLKRIHISDRLLFILFFMDTEEKKVKINELLPDFIKRIEDLILRYIF